ncbi:MAG: STAS domain-containing protein [Oscillatoriales cyanobacterium SM2_1_8]|nr:STAS domain-containing protein [Oscillatoriales cyanobacterium SM2_1_8]
MRETTVQLMEPKGKLDVTNAAQFRSQVNTAIAAKAQYLIVDLADVNFMDSSGLGALVAALKAVRASGSELVVCSLSEQVQMLFDLTSMSKIFKVYRSRRDFAEKEGIVL